MLTECNLVGPIWRTLWKFLKKLKIEPLYYAPIPILDIHLGKTKTLIQKDTYTVMFIEALLTVGKIWKQPKYPSRDDWINEMYIHMGFPGGLVVNNPPAKVVDANSIPGSGKSPGEG